MAPSPRPVHPAISRILRVGDEPISQVQLSHLHTAALQMTLPGVKTNLFLAQKQFSEAQKSFWRIQAQMCQWRSLYYEMNARNCELQGEWCKMLARLWGF
jgi:hypothetical protein